MPQVFNKHIHDVPADAVYIGRPSKWGNPFPITPGANRRTVIDRYRKWLYNRPELMEQARQELAGKDLVCYCSPQECHGDVLLEVANNKYLDREREFC